MSLGQRDPFAMHRTAGVDAELWYDFAPGQRVKTIDGLPGTVIEVQDGFAAAAEQYVVELDGGLGGGEYAADELTPLAGATAKLAVVEGAHVASDDYPELEDILEERPPPRHALTASKVAVEDESEESALDRSYGFADGLDAALDRYYAPDPNASKPYLNGYDEGFTEGQKKWGALAVEAMWIVADGDGSIHAGPFVNRYLAEDAKAELVNEAAAQGLTLYVQRDDTASGDYMMDAQAGVLDKAVDWMADKSHYEPGRNVSYDWCRFRREQHCWYPRHLNTEATKEAGYAVWIPEDRGYCPRNRWEDQKICPAPSEPGPRSGEPHRQVDATVPWEEGGQRTGSLDVPVAIRTTADRLLHVEEIHPGMKVIDNRGEHEVAQVLNTHFTLDPEDEIDFHKQWYLMKFRDGGQMHHIPEGTSMLVAASVDPELRFHFEGSWKDIQEKAKKIRAEGHVRIISATAGYVTAEVRGDSNVYQTTIMRAPGKKSIAMWECGCAWANYSWGRSGRWKKYEGRMCAHALATQYEANAREMFGKEISEDRKLPQWRSDPTIPVVVPGDSRVKPTPWRVGLKVVAWGDDDEGYDDYDSERDRLGYNPWECPFCERMNPEYTIVCGGCHKCELCGQVVPSYPGSSSDHANRHETDPVGGWMLPTLKQSTIPVVVPGDSRVKPTPWRVSSLQMETFHPAVEPFMDPMMKKLVDYRPERPLANPSKALILSTVLPGTPWVPYSRMPFFDALHDAFGVDPDKDKIDELVAAREKQFGRLKTQPIKIDPKKLVFTQPTVNADKVNEMATKGVTPGGPPAFFVQYNDRYYVIDGHHRLVAQMLNGVHDINAKILNLDGTYLGVLKVALPSISTAPSMDEIVKWYQKAAHDEEPRVSRDVQYIANAEGGMTAGFAFRIKSPKRVEEKLREKGPKKLERGIPPTEWVQDSLRYTIVFHPAVYSKAVQDSLYRFEEKGYKLASPNDPYLSEENSWSPGDSYSGLHYTMHTPGGLTIEIQFHTAESYILKAKTLHTMYERFREPSTPLREKQELFDLMTKYWDEVEIPKDVLKFPVDKHFPRPVAGLNPRPVWIDPELQISPLAAMRKEADLKARVRGAITLILALVGLDKVKLINGTVVPAVEVEHPNWTPGRGIVDYKPFKQAWNLSGWDTASDEYVDCNRCEGTGHVNGHTCDFCAGTGKMVADDIRAVAALEPDPDQYELLSSSRGNAYTHVGMGKTLNHLPMALCGTTVAPLDSLWTNYMNAMAQATCQRCLDIMRKQHSAALVDYVPFGRRPPPPVVKGKDTCPNCGSHSIATDFGGIKVCNDCDFDWQPSSRAAALEVDAEVETTLHDEPEPALPETDGISEADDDDCFYAQRVSEIRDQRAGLAPMTALQEAGPTTALVGPSWLQASDNGSGRVQQHKAVNAEIAQMAGRFLKEGAKAFTAEEQALYINEDTGEPAGNLDRLDIAGTHYEAMEKRMVETDENWMY